MGFFSDLKEDLSQAVNELMPQEQPLETETEEKKTDGEKPADVASEISLDEMLKNIDDFCLPEDEMSGAADPKPVWGAEVGTDAVDETGEQVADVLTEVSADPAAGLWTVEELPEDPEPETEISAEAALEAKGEQAEAAFEAKEEQAEEAEVAWGWKTSEDVPSEEATSDSEASEDVMSVDAAFETEAPAAMTEAETAVEAEEVPVAEAEPEAAEEQDVEMMLSQMFGGTPDAEPQEDKEEVQKEENKGAEEAMETMEMNERVVLDETSIITRGMVVTGDINTEGSVDVAGTVNGNIDAYGKLNITGHVNGNSKAAEIYAENAKINGQIISEGAVKIESSTVIIGNITATSAAIAGAVKGDIDVKGPVILDASAIVMGNIKSKSVQINNGAVIEGMCSQCYADVNPTSFFDDYKPEVQTKSKSK